MKYFYVELMRFLSNVWLGVSLDLAGNSACLYTSFDTIISQKFCGCKATDFIGAVCSHAFVVASGNDIAAVLAGYDQVFRRLLTRVKEANSPVESLTFLLKDREAIDDQKKIIISYLENMWDEIHDGRKVYCL